MNDSHPLGIAVYETNLRSLRGWMYKHLIRLSVGSKFYHMAPFIGPYQLEITPSHPSRWVAKDAITRLPHYTHVTDCVLLEDTQLTFMDFSGPRWIDRESIWWKMVLHYNTQSTRYFTYDCYQLSRDFAMQFYPNKLNRQWDPAGWLNDLRDLTGD